MRCTVVRDKYSISEDNTKFIVKPKNQLNIFLEILNNYLQVETENKIARIKLFLSLAMSSVT